MTVSTSRQKRTGNLLPNLLHNARKSGGDVILCSSPSNRQNKQQCSQERNQTTACDIRHWRKLNLMQSSIVSGGLILSTRCSLTTSLISAQFLGKKMLFLLLFIMACLMDTSKTKKFNLDDYMQMVQHKQPVVADFQQRSGHLLSAYKQPDSTSLQQLTHSQSSGGSNRAAAAAAAAVRHKLQPIVDYHQSPAQIGGRPSARLTLLNSQVPLTRYHRHLNQQQQQLQAQPQRNESNNDINNNNQGHSTKYSHTIESNANDQTRVTVNYQNHQNHQNHYLASDHSEFNHRNDKQLNLKLIDSGTSPHLNERMATAESSTTYRTNSAPSTTTTMSSLLESNTSQLASQSPQFALLDNEQQPKSTSLSGGGGGGGTNNGPVAMASSLAGAIENPLAHLLDPTTLDFMSNPAGSESSPGHYDYAYQAPPQPPVAATQFAIASLSPHHHYQHHEPSLATTNSTMALYRLLNLIDQQQTPASLTFGTANSKPYSPFDNPYHYHTIGSNLNSNNKSNLYNSGYYHQPRYNHQLASQTSPSSMPNHWSSSSSSSSRKRVNNPLLWPTAAMRQPSDGGDKHPFDNSNLIDVQPPSGSALKLLKSSSSLPGASSPYYHLPAGARKNHSHMNLQAPPSSSSTVPHQHHRSSYYSYNHNHNYNHQPSYHGGHANNLHNGSSSSSSSSSSANNNNFNSLLNNEDIGFGNKYSPSPTMLPVAPPPPSSSSSLPPSSSSTSQQRERERERDQQIVNNNNNSNNSEKLAGGALTSSSSLANSKVPHDADSEMIAANNAPRCDKFTPDICVDDFEYPEQAIIDEIEKKHDVFQLMYSEVTDNEPLVDGIPRDVEESYNYDYYYYGKTNLTQAASGPPLAVSQMQGGGGGGAGSTTTSSTPSDGLRHRSRVVEDTLDGLPMATRASSPPAATSAIDGMDALIGTAPQATAPVASSQSPPTTGYICPSEVMYGKPKLAKNKKGLWKVIVNAGKFTQTVRLEKCLFPNKKCNYVSAHNYESRCAQVHSHHRLLVFEKGRGFYIDTFRLPTGCNCYVSKKPFSSAASSSTATSTASSSSGSMQQSSNRRDSSASFQDGAQSANNNLNNNELNSNGQNRANRLPALLGDSSFNPQNFRANGGHRDSSSTSSQSMLSQTLWSILSGGGSGGHAGSSGGGGGSHHGGENPFNAFNSYNANNYEPASSDNGNSNGYHSAPPGSQYQPAGGERNSNQREAYQSQSLILEHLSQNPSLAANISNSVLRQLIDVGQISASGTTSQSDTASAEEAAHQQQQYQQQRPQLPG